MSTIFLNTSLNTCSAAYVNHFAVSNQRPETLAEFVRRVRVQVKEFSLSEVERNSNGEIDGSYVSRIENGLVKNVTPEKLKALATGLEVSEEEIFAVARGKPLTYQDPLDEIKALFHGWEDATDDERAAALDDLKMIAERFQRRLRERLKESTAVKEKTRIARVAASLHPPGWETQPGPGREGEKPIFSASKKGKQSQPDKKSRQA